jgi:hypothetical protein
MVGCYLYRASCLHTVSWLSPIFATSRLTSVGAIPYRTLLAQAGTLSMALVLSDFLLVWLRTAQ